MLNIKWKLSYKIRAWLKYIEVPMHTTTGDIREDPGFAFIHGAAWYRSLKNSLQAEQVLHATYGIECHHHFKDGGNPKKKPLHGHAEKHEDTALKPSCVLVTKRDWM